MQTPEFYEPNFVLNCFCVKLGYHQQTYLSGTDKSFLSPGKMVQGIGMVKDFVNFIITIKRQYPIPTPTKNHRREKLFSLRSILMLTDFGSISTVLKLSRAVVVVAVVVV